MTTVGLDPASPLNGALAVRLVTKVARFGIVDAGGAETVGPAGRLLKTAYMVAPHIAAKDVLTVMAAPAETEEVPVERRDSYL